ncbi:hypothetical protein [Streptomyces sp. SLBN-31]|jgi:hypothetical protein|uniref:hypothetical protein n=1 Tax=Streptomyces sp. SLBN-31 TaxID=2768444 RepID=UPI0011544B3A|nr:hypothetical protein [Streptomyces sp. SLBN-31]TQJ89414.1 hypothetical protein FBY22_0176 [Streptomyces sp. SLBN-31]
MSELGKWHEQLRRSLREARDQRHDAEAVPPKVAGVIEDLVHLAAAAQGEAFLANRRAYRFSYDEYTTELRAPTTADRETYRLAHGNLLDEAEALVRDLRAHHFPPGTLREGVAAAGEEKAVALGLEAASYISLPDARRAARHGGKGIEAAIKVGQYLLGPAPLTLANDVTEVVGDAVRNIGEERLRDLLQAPPLTAATSTTARPPVPSPPPGWGPTGP